MDLQPFNIFQPLSHKGRGERPSIGKKTQIPHHPASSGSSTAHTIWRARRRRRPCCHIECRTFGESVDHTWWGQYNRAGRNTDSADTGWMGWPQIRVPKAPESSWWNMFHYPNRSQKSQFEFEWVCHTQVQQSKICKAIFRGSITVSHCRPRTSHWK